MEPSYIKYTCIVVGVTALLWYFYPFAVSETAVSKPAHDETESMIDLNSDLKSESDVTDMAASCVPPESERDVSEEFVTPPEDIPSSQCTCVCGRCVRAPSPSLTPAVAQHELKEMSLEETSVLFSQPFGFT